MPGPPPKRSEQRRRVNVPAAGEPTKVPGATDVRPPRADSKWHPIAKRWFNALGKSGQARFYEPSDWAMAYVVAESMSQEFKPRPMAVGFEIQHVAQPPRANMVATWLRACATLMVTEGDRRRLALELQRPKAEEGEDDVAWLDDARTRLAKSG